jgi:hypothetical protein
MSFLCSSICCIPKELDGKVKTRFGGALPKQGC